MPASSSFSCSASRIRWHLGLAIDFFVALILVWSLVRGWKQGFLYQIGYLAALVIAYALARGLSPHLASLIGSKVPLPPLVMSTISFLAVFGLIAGMLSLFVRKMTRELMPKSFGISQMNHTLGALAGLIKGGLLSYIGLVILLQYVATQNRPAVQTSRALQWVAENQDFIANGRPGALAKLVWILSSHREDLASLAKDPRGKRLLAHPKAQTLYSPEIMQAVTTQDYMALLGNEAVWEFLNDPEVRLILSEFSWLEEPKSH